MDAPLSFFVSYRGADVSLALWVERLLHSFGYATFIQALDFQVGTDFEKKIAEGANKTWTVPVMTESYFESPWTLREWQSAALQDKLIPLCFMSPHDEGWRKLKAAMPAGLDKVAVVFLGGLRGSELAKKVERVIWQRLFGRSNNAQEDSSDIVGKHCITNVPETRHRFFFASSHGELQQLQQLLFSDYHSGCRLHSITGPPGVGKTWLMEYCGRELANSGRFDAIFVLPDASSPAKIDECLASLSVLLGPKFSPAERVPQSEARAAVLEWLTQIGRWLLIAENASSRESLHALQALFPPGSPGHVVVVSREPLHDGPGDVILRFLDNEDGARFLLARARVADPSAQDKEAARRLASAVGGVPQALDWIGLRVREHGLAFNAIGSGDCEDWKQRALQNLRPLVQALLDEFVRLPPGPRLLMEVLCQWQGDRIPFQALEKVELPDGINAAESFSLLTSSALGHTDRGFVFADPITCEILNERLGSVRFDRVELACRAALAHAERHGPPSDSRTWSTWLQLQPALRTLWRTLSARSQWPPSALMLLTSNAHFLAETSSAADARELLDALEARGLDTLPPRVQQARREIEGRLALEAGRAEDAARWWQQALDAADEDAGVWARLAVLLAGALRELGRRTESETLYRQALAIFNAADSRGDAAQTASSLSQCLLDLGRDAEALDIARSAWLTAREVYKHGHPITAAVAANYASCMPLERETEAVSLLRETLETLDQNGLSQRTVTADVLVNLVVRGGAAGAEDAERCLRRALVIYERNLGVNHRTTSTVRASLDRFEQKFPR